MMVECTRPNVFYCDDDFGQTLITLITLIIWLTLWIFWTL
nr:MAG: hypothetical protein AmFV_00227 [Apis mellifera filamentous virus]WOK43341.1 MAG: hypothetical protein [Apis mellifera filamentous virus]